MGAQQVGKAAICGWRVCLPRLLDPALDLDVWPFTAVWLIRFNQDRVIVAETYPADIYAKVLP